MPVAGQPRPVHSLLTGLWLPSRNSIPDFASDSDVLLTEQGALLVLFFSLVMSKRVPPHPSHTQFDSVH